MLAHALALSGSQCCRQSKGKQHLQGSQAMEPINQDSYVFAATHLWMQSWGGTVTHQTAAWGLTQNLFAVQ
jgi:hypothetical protein